MLNCSTKLTCNQSDSLLILKVKALKNVPPKSDSLTLKFLFKNCSQAFGRQMKFNDRDLPLSR